MNDIETPTLELVTPETDNSDNNCSPERTPSSDCYPFGNCRPDCSPND